MTRPLASRRMVPSPPIWLARLGLALFAANVHSLALLNASEPPHATPAPTDGAPAAAWLENDSSLKAPFTAGARTSHRASAHAATNSTRTKPDGIASAFKHNSAFISNSNLTLSAHDTERLTPREHAELVMRLAYRQRIEKNYDLAANNFASLVQGNAPEELKREALLELAVTAQERNQPEKAQQVYAQFLRKYPNDDSVPEIFLRQGILYRQMGAPVLAQSKFFAVMTSALTLKKGDLDYHRRLVLHAQSEIADTAYGQGGYQEAAEYYARLLKLDSAELNKTRIQFRLIRCLTAMSRHSEMLSQAEEFLVQHPGASEEPEVRFLAATALKQTGRNEDALKQVLQLLQSQSAAARSQPERWAYWQQRTGNDIGNQMYQEGDYLDALAIYTALAVLSSAPAWQLPVHYQSGLIYERLQQPQKAIEIYRAILAREKDLGAEPAPAVKTVIDMARWRAEFLTWQSKVQQPAAPVLTNAQLVVPDPSAAAH